MEVIAGLERQYSQNLDTLHQLEVGHEDVPTFASIEKFVKGPLERTLYRRANSGAKDQLLIAPLLSPGEDELNIQEIVDRYDRIRAQIYGAKIPQSYIDDSYLAFAQWGMVPEIKDKQPEKWEPDKHGQYHKAPTGRNPDNRYKHGRLSYSEHNSGHQQGMQVGILMDSDVPGDFEIAKEEVPTSPISISQFVVWHALMLKADQTFPNEPTRFAQYNHYRTKGFVTAGDVINFAMGFAIDNTDYRDQDEQEMQLYPDKRLLLTTAHRNPQGVERHTLVIESDKL